MKDVKCWICKKKKPLRIVTTILSSSESGAKIKTIVCHNCMNQFDDDTIISLIDSKIDELDKIYINGKNIS